MLKLWFQMLTIHYAGEFSQRAGALPWHRHSWMQLDVVESGEVVLLAGNREWHLRAGELVFIAGDVPHAWRAPAPMRGLTFKFEGEFVADEAVQLYAASDDVWRAALPRRAMETWRRGDAADVAASCGLLTGLLHLLRAPNSLRAPQPVLPGEAHWLQLLEELKSASGPLLNLNEMARRVHCSPAHFRRLFEARLGIAPARYQMQCRMERARGLLQFTSLPIGQIAEQLGFADASSFSKAFVRAWEQRPSKMREL